MESRGECYEKNSKPFNTGSNDVGSNRNKPNNDSATIEQDDKPRQSRFEQKRGSKRGGKNKNKRKRTEEKEGGRDVKREDEGSEEDDGGYIKMKKFCGLGILLEKRIENVGKQNTSADEGAESEHSELNVSTSQQDLIKDDFNQQNLIKDDFTSSTDKTSVDEVETIKNNESIQHNIETSRSNESSLYHEKPDRNTASSQYVNEGNSAQEPQDISNKEVNGVSNIEDDNVCSEDVHVHVDNQSFETNDISNADAFIKANDISNTGSDKIPNETCISDDEDDGRNALTSLMLSYVDGDSDSMDEDVPIEIPICKSETELEKSLQLSQSTNNKATFSTKDASNRSEMNSNTNTKPSENKPIESQSTNKDPSEISNEAESKNEKDPNTGAHSNNQVTKSNRKRTHAKSRCQNQSKLAKNDRTDGDRGKISKDPFDSYSQVRTTLRRHRGTKLLEKLLEDDIIHERNVILQCVHYIVKNKFLQQSSP
uniref:Uncharacterized protein n=1 Tax=Cacopsylla melanoneura TaxID=428564 RepID=A0A8D8UIG9_9HEMI